MKERKNQEVWNSNAKKKNKGSPKQEERQNATKALKPDLPENTFILYKIIVAARKSLLNNTESVQI